MKDNISDIAAFYDLDVEDEDSRLVLHQLEYDLTWRYLARYLPPKGSILEIGAGTGRYTLELCRRGYSVTAVDLSAALLRRCEQRLEAEGLHGQVQLVVADARDLQAVAGTTFDAVLLMGPLYHLLEEVSADETTIGASRHLLYVGRKTGPGQRQRANLVGLRIWKEHPLFSPGNVLRKLGEDLATQRMKRMGDDKALLTIRIIWCS